MGTGEAVMNVGLLLLLWFQKCRQMVLAVFFRWIRILFLFFIIHVYLINISRNSKRNWILLHPFRCWLYLIVFNICCIFTSTGFRPKQRTGFGFENVPTYIFQIPYSVAFKIIPNHLIKCHELKSLCKSKWKQRSVNYYLNVQFYND